VTDILPSYSPARRRFLALSLALLTSTAITQTAFAQAAPPADQPKPTPPAPKPFSFDILTNDMRQKAKTPFQSGEIQLPKFIAELNYDSYQKIQFRPDHARWSEPGSLFRLHAFHLGWLFKEPVQLYEVENGMAQHLEFTTADFKYYNELDNAKGDLTLPGIAGFRLNFPINRADILDELAAFLGSSYFRALGRNNVYGQSARGLSIDTGLDDAEEFPRFSDFWLEKQPDGSRSVIVNAALDSQSVTGAYRFEIFPGDDCVMNVTARLFFRKDVRQLGIAPLTSMFLFAENNRISFDDYRPQVHDSNGLVIERADGDVLWRPLNNPPVLSNTYFDEMSPRGFGLMQRDRNFENYQDAAAHYERRPSARVEPIGDWGKGTVRLLELPSEFEFNDNIVAFWQPQTPAKAGDEREFSYKLSWGDLDPSPAADLAFVAETRTGHGGLATMKGDPTMRKFVVDFEGGTLGNLPDETQIQAVTTVSAGTIITSTLSRIPANGLWRMVLDVKRDGDKPVELNAHLAGFGQRLSETWLYQWRA
jgi:glucans biosynthesis protein